MPDNEVTDTIAEEMSQKEWKLNILLVFISCVQKMLLYDKLTYGWSKNLIQIIKLESLSIISEVKMTLNVWNFG